MIVYAADTDLRKLLVQAGVSGVKLEQDRQEYPHLVQHALEWMGVSDYIQRSGN
jgi:hypothetical protein